LLNAILFTLDNFWLIFNLKVSDEKQELPSTEEESLSQQKVHKMILDKGPPDDRMPGLKDVQVKLVFFKWCSNLYILKVL
jgi:hypothetical protein